MRWTDIQQALTEFDLTAVNVLGIDRSFVLKSTREVADIEAISSTVADDYHVSSVLLRSGSEDSDVSVQFGNFIAIAAATVPAGEIGRMAVRLLGYRNPVPDAELEAVLPRPPSAVLRDAEGAAAIDEGPPPIASG